MKVKQQHCRRDAKRCTQKTQNLGLSTLALVIATFSDGSMADASSWAPWASPLPALAQTQSVDQLFNSSSEQPQTTSDDSGSGSVDSLFDASKPTTPQPATSTSETATDSDAKDALFSSETVPGSASTGESYSLRGFVQNELAYTYPSPDHFSKFKNTLQLTADGRLANGWGWRLGGRLVYDPIYDATNFYPEAVRDDQSLEATLREAYVDFGAGDFEFRLGRQHIIWGEVVGGFIADVVSAKDFRESIVQDFDLLRIPQWAAMVEHYRGDFYAQALWIPYMSVNDIGEAGSDFYPFVGQIPPGVNTVFRGDDRPSPTLSNSGFGARASYLYSGWDSSLFYFTSMDQNPAFRRELIAGATPTLVFTPIHKRIHQVGATIAKDFSAALIRLESVYTIDRLFEVSSLGDPDGLVRKNVLDYLISAEWGFAKDTQLIFQFFQRWVPDHVTTMIPDELESGYSVYLSTKAVHPDLKPELLWIQGLNRSDWLLEAKLNWEFTDNWRAVVGADIFGGRPIGLFGRYDNNDRVYYELRYSF